MNKIVYLFPGQGSQYPGMGKEFAAAFAIARETFEEADDILEMKLSRVLFEGPENLLLQTRMSQPAIFVMSIAIVRVIEQQIPEITPTICSGLSLGEYSALCASRKLGFTETLLLVRERAEYMHDACERTEGTMIAVLGLDAAKVEKLLQGEEDVLIANYNAPGQLVLSGTKEAVTRVSHKLREAGAKRIIPLAVHGAFHSKLMQTAQDLLAPSIKKAPLEESPTSFVMNVPGDTVTSLPEMRSYLIQQITHPVRWEQGIRAMREVDCFLEIGCGKTLTGLNRKMGITAPTLSIEHIKDLEQMVATCSS